MNLYVVLYHHRDGVDPHLLRAAKEPTEGEMYSALGIAEEDVLDDEYVEAVLVESSGCDKDCQGWAVYNGNEIQRCDICGRFGSDEEAVNHVRKLERLEKISTVGSPDEAARGELVEVRNALASIVEESETNPSVSVKKLVDRLKVLLETGLLRSFWEDRRQGKCASQFVRILGGMYSVGEEEWLHSEVPEDDEVEDLEGNPEGVRNRFVIDVADLEGAVGMKWEDIVFTMECALSLHECARPEVTR